MQRRRGLRQWRPGTPAPAAASARTEKLLERLAVLERNRREANEEEQRPGPAVLPQRPGQEWQGQDERAVQLQQGQRPGDDGHGAGERCEGHSQAERACCLLTAAARIGS